MGNRAQTLTHRLADQQRFKRVGTECQQRLLKAGSAAGAVAGCAVGHRKNPGAHASVAGNQRRQFRHVKIVGLQMLDQLDEDLRHGRQARNQQPMTKILIRSIHHLEHSRSLGWGGSTAWRRRCHDAGRCGARHEEVYQAMFNYLKTSY